MEVSMIGYEWLKFWHFAAFISWMAVLFYQPRLYVYHSENLENKDFIRVIKKQEKMLFHGIGWIAMIITYISAILIIVFYKPDLMKTGYFHIKLLCVVLMSIYHFSMYYFLVKFKNDACRLSGKFFRAYNEIPTIIMFVILWAMLVKPYA
ncbi:CopD family protein [Campylobacter portucalensis]|nr:CopD family protein [Campylobacter portucalensis]